MRGGGFAREKGILALAWISYGLAVAGGAAITATFAGSIIAGFVGFFPDWVAIVGFLAGFVVMVIDLIVDGTPNRAAVGIAIVLPSVARAVPGKLSETVTNLSNAILAQINEALGVWLGTTSALGIAAAAVVASLLVARRVVAKGGR